MVHGLQDDARAEGPVADDGHDEAIVVRPEQVVAALHAHGRADAAPGMAGEEQVIGAFGRVGIAHQAALGPHRVERLVAAGHQLVRIDLVAGIPDQAVAAEIEGGVQGQGQLDHAQVRGEMGRPSGRQAANGLANLARQLHQLLLRQPLQVAGGADRGKQAQAVHQRSLSST